MAPPDPRHDCFHSRRWLQCVQAQQLVVSCQVQGLEPLLWLKEKPWQASAETCDALESLCWGASAGPPGVAGALVKVMAGLMETCAAIIGEWEESHRSTQHPIGFHPGPEVRRC